MNFREGQGASEIAALPRAPEPNAPWGEQPERSAGHTVLRRGARTARPSTAGPSPVPRPRPPGCSPCPAVLRAGGVCTSSGAVGGCASGRPCRGPGRGAAVTLRGRGSAPCSVQGQPQASRAQHTLPQALRVQPGPPGPTGLGSGTVRPRPWAMSLGRRKWGFRQPGRLPRGGSFEMGLAGRGCRRLLRGVRPLPPPPLLSRGRELVHMTYHLRPSVPSVTWGHTSSKRWGSDSSFSEPWAQGRLQGQGPRGCWTADPSSCLLQR